MTPPLSVVPETSAGGRDDLGGRRWWAGAGVVVGLAGLGVSQFFAELLSVKETPLMAVVESLARLSPGSLAQATAEFLAKLATPLVLVLAVLVVVLLFALGGLLWRRSPWAALPLWVALAGAELAAGLLINGPGLAQVLPVGLGLLAWLTSMALLAPKLHAVEAADAAAAGGAPQGPGHARRSVVIGLAVTTLAAAAFGGGTWWLERRRAAVRESRRLLRIPGVTRPVAPAGAEFGVDGLTPWQSSTDDFHTVSTALRVPALEASQWTLNIHGQVRAPLVLTYEGLLARGLVESWMTTASVMNTVGGQVVDNAWFSGVATKLLLDEVGVLEGADAVLQTSADGSVRITPLSVLSDERPAMLAVAMNGAALQLEHGFPVRTVVPGHYEEAVNCKWVIDWEVTSFADAPETVADLAWSRRVPVRLASRIDLPADGDQVKAGLVRLGGMAWHPGAGIEAVEFAVDGGAWRPAEVAQVDEDHAWVQWTARARMAPGGHVVRVRAINRRGEKQPAVLRDPLPSGASGWHEVSFTVEDPSKS